VSRTSGRWLVVPGESPNTFLKGCEYVEDGWWTEMKLVPPLQHLRDPRVVWLCQLFTEEDVEAFKVNLFPHFSPFLNGAQCDVRLTGEYH